MAILVTGGAGFIGSNTVVELQSAGYEVVVLDNLSNSSEKSLERVQQITGKPVKFYKTDILDREGLNEVFEKEQIDSCIHFAGLKAVGESVVKPWEYYENNIAGTLTLDVYKRQVYGFRYRSQFLQNLYPHTVIPRSYDVHLKSKNHSGIHSSGLCIFFLWKALNPAVHSDKPRKNFLSEQKLWFLNIVSNYHSNKIVVNSQMICLNV